MRTLSRPMFNMGGPIKQGIMHGIREPYRGGGAALVGNPVYPQTAGREHHNIWLQAGNVAGRGIRAFKNIFGKTVTKPGSFSRVTPKTTMVGEDIYKTKMVPGGSGPIKNIAQTTEFQPSGVGKYLAGTPEWAAAKGIYAGKGIVTKPIKYALKSPLLTGAGLVWAGNKWVWGDGTPASEAEIAKITEGQHGPFDHTDKKKIKKAQDAFAEAQRDTRVQKYLDMMGYDRSKKTAVADALIDASKIVSDRGTLETKNITRDLISPIIQATSKRFDKPEQIREAVGLMSVKAAITKDLEDPSIKALRMKQLEKLTGGFEKDLGELLLSTKGTKVTKGTLEKYARVKANEYGLPFTVVDETTVIGKEPGVYMVEDKIFRVDENGQATQVV
jgi:hypothetical protein